MSSRRNGPSGSKRANSPNDTDKANRSSTFDMLPYYDFRAEENEDDSQAKYVYTSLNSDLFDKRLTEQDLVPQQLYLHHRMVSALVKQVNRMAIQANNPSRSSFTAFERV